MGVLVEGGDTMGGDTMGDDAMGVVPDRMVVGDWVRVVVVDDAGGGGGGAADVELVYGIEVVLQLEVLMGVVVVVLHDAVVVTGGGG
jgi:hypothetical protein